MFVIETSPMIHANNKPGRVFIECASVYLEHYLGSDGKSWWIEKRPYPFSAETFWAPLEPWVSTWGAASFVEYLGRGAASQATKPFK